MKKVHAWVILLNRRYRGAFTMHVGQLVYMQYDPGLKKKTWLCKAHI